METAVASGVDHHYVERFGLPVAAAFVAGLGQAVALSGSSFAANPVYGGYAASYNHFNAGQLIGIGAGAAGAQASQLLAAAAPRGPTVNLAANAQVGVLFLAPVEVPELVRAVARSAASRTKRRAMDTIAVGLPGEAEPVTESNGTGD